MGKGLLDYTVVPNFRRLGPKVGKLMPKVKDLLVTADGAAVRELHAEDRGMLFMVAGDSLVSIYVALETMALASYVLAGYFKEQILPIEIKVKGGVTMFPRAGFDDRVANSVRYVTPNMSGFVGIGSAVETDPAWSYLTEQVPVPRVDSAV